MGMLHIVVQLSSDLTGLRGPDKPATHFINFDTSLSVGEVVSMACEFWEIDEEEHKCCLVFEDTKEYLTDGKYSNIESLQSSRIFCHIFIFF